MMSMYYLCTAQTGFFEPGHLIKTDKDKISMIHPNLNDIPKPWNISHDWIEITELKWNYMQRVPIAKRVIFHNNRLFEKIEHLQLFDQCYIRQNDKETQFCEIIRKKDSNIEMKTKKGYESVSIVDIHSIKLIQHYICSREYNMYKEGTLVREISGQLVLVPNNEVIIIPGDYLKKISRKEVLFLLKHSLDDRLKMFNDKLFETIFKMAIGDKCILVSDLNGPVYKVSGKSLTNNSVEYILSSKDKNNIAVDISMIRPLTVQEKDEDKGRLSKQEIDRDKRNSSINKTSSFKSILREDGKLSTSFGQDSSMYRYKPLNMVIINPRNNMKVDEQDFPIYSERILIFKESRTFATLKWKGIIDDKMFIGCETETELKDLRYDDVNLKQLFHCEDKKRLFVAIRDNNQICERDTTPIHNPITTNKYQTINEDCICCIDSSVDKAFDYICKVIPLTNDIAGTCKWQGLINGVECLGVQLIESSLSIGYKPNGLVGRINIFHFDKNQGALVTIKDIPSDILCPNNNINIANIIIFRSVTQSDLCDKIVVLKQNNNIVVVTVKWTGTINERRYLGCQLNNNSKYGTKGTFSDVPLFDCTDKRGVLVELNDSLECCETGTHDESSAKKHRIIKPSAKNVWIDDKSICCVESKDKLEFGAYLKIDKTIIVTENFWGKIVWNGLINGEESIGLRLANNKYGSEASFIDSYVFQNVHNTSVLVRVADLSSNIRCEVDNLSIVNRTLLKTVFTLTVHNKKVLLKQGNCASIVTLKWKGTVNGRKCLGFVLNKDSKFGTNGSFIGIKCFDCSDKRGVLIEVNESVQCCEKDFTDDVGQCRTNIASGDTGSLDESMPQMVHKAIVMLKNIFIDEKCICCVESKDRFNNTDNIKIGYQIILAETITGTIKWLGLINAVECIVIEMSGYKTLSSAAMRDTWFELKSSNYVIVKLTDIPKIIHCEQLNHFIINPSNISMIKKADAIYKYVILEIKEKLLNVEVMWQGEIDGRMSAGCALPFDYKYGTDGKFNDQLLISCSPRRGILMEIDELYKRCKSENESHKALTRFLNLFLEETSICCIETLHELNSIPQITLGTEIFLKMDRHKLPRICLWIGKINGKECVGLECSIKNGGNGIIYGVKLYDCKPGSGVLCEVTDIEIVPKVELIKGKYLKNNQSIEDLERTVHKDKYKLMKVDDDPPIYGRALFTVFGQYMTAITLTREFAECAKDKLADITYNEDNATIILVVAKCIEIFKEILKCIPETNIIDISSIKITENTQSSSLTAGDIVSYSNRSGICHGKIDKFSLLNDVRCLGISNFMDIGQVNRGKYIREDAVINVVRATDHTKYIKGVIYNPQSIFIFTDLIMDNVGKNDEVEFKILGDLEFYKGKVLMTARANLDPCVVVELTKSLKDVDMAACDVRYIGPFRELCSSSTNNVIIVADCVIRVIAKKILKCDDNNVCVLHPNKVQNVKSGTVEDKLLIFKSNQITIMTKLKWTGTINNVVYLGCEMRNKSNYGTNGTFSNITLFECNDGCGVLIPFDKIEECCVRIENGNILTLNMLKSPHKPVNKVTESVIMENSICCIKTVEKLREKSELCVNDRVMNVNGNIFGVCRWIGLVNNKEAVAVEMIHREGDGWFNRLAWSGFPSGNIVMLLAVDIVLDSIGLCFCQRNDVVVVDINNIQCVENGNVVDKKIIYKDNKKNNFTLDIKWRGIVNGALCVGYESTTECNCRFDGFFNGEKIFHCLPRKGVIIPVDRLTGSCEYAGHKDISKTFYGTINIESICCVEGLDRIDRWPMMKKNSRIKYKGTIVSSSDKVGKCKWMGKLNGKDSIGVKMNEPFANGTTGRFSLFDLFACNNNHGVLFLSDDIEHDTDGEKLHFFVDKFVNVNKIQKVKPLKNDEGGISIGDYVRTYLNKEDQNRTYNGELKWKGLINSEKCVGIDLEDKCDFAMSGKIYNKFKFDCLPEHGVLTTMDNVQQVERLTLPLINGMVDSSKYLRIEEIWFESLLAEKNVSKNGLVFVIIDTRLLKGILRWSGIMNEEKVALVELDHECDGGTNGFFWRKQLVKCDDKKVIAVPWDNVHQYQYYMRMEIPNEERIFKEIDVNSAVIYYIAKNSMLTKMYGTVRWSGMCDGKKYVYGIELDDRYKDGTNGYFNGELLFQCNDGHAVIAPIKTVAPDTRFTEAILEDKDIPESQISDTFQFATPVKSFRGENKGIQGNANSCYFDSSLFALFSKSDVLDFMISPKLNEIETNDITKRFRNYMAWQIIYPLREHGYVSFHRTQRMRNIIKDYGGKFLEMTKQETDMENVAALLSKLYPDSQLLNFRSFTGFNNRGMFLQLFVILNRRLTNINSQQMLDMSMAQNEIMFEKPPTCLIMQAPRDARGINCYSNVLPSMMIEISNLCIPCHKTCIQCGNEAEYQCKICIEQRSLRTKDGLFCEKHKCIHGEILSLPKSHINSKSEVQMILKAIICIEKAHFVAYVKEDEFKKEWVFFDSMSTQNIATNYAVPKVSFEKGVSHFLQMSEEDMVRELMAYGSEDLKRIAKDSYIFVYHNTSQTCY